MNNPEVSLIVEDQVFTAKKELLCEHSDYFRAMFSGNYVEKERQEISINIVDSNSMGIILRYMEIGMIDIFELPLPTVGELAIAANFLQITELVKQIEYCLDLQLSLSNWVDTMAIAKNASYNKLEELSAAYGLLSFKNMKPEYIPTIHTLFWYLSHPYLDAENELDVFKFGLQWILHTETGADALLILLSCIDMSRLVNDELKEMKSLIKDYENSLAEKVVQCLYKLSTDFDLSLETITTRKMSLCETFTERVYSEVLNLVRESIRRKLEYTPVIPMWVGHTLSPANVQSGMLYTFTKDKCFTKWLEVTEKDLWGWSIVSWGASKLVVVCGERGRGTGTFMKDVKVYDTLRKEWTRHGVQLPPRRHAGVAVVGGLLYLIGGVGGFRVVLDTALVYDLKQRSYRKIAKLPDALQSPAVCVHENEVFAASQKNIYRYEDNGELDRWKAAAVTDIRIDCMVSYKGYIYCTQNYFPALYRFKPDVEDSLELVTNFTNPPVALCNLRDRCMVFTSSTNRTFDQMEVLVVEEYSGTEDRPKVVWSQDKPSYVVNDVAGSCALVMSIPPINTGISPYHKKYLDRYS